ncbi:hypothetical protein AHF37_10030 [Paragonimus kellicotti]|nr:hypothetical protein AHF37_10030 [Paragonimus kellicotti]
MKFPSTSADMLCLPEAKITVHLLRIEFADHILISLSEDGKFGDLVLSVKYTPVASLSGDPTHCSADTRTLLGVERVNSHLLTRHIEKVLNTEKTLLVTNSLKRDVSFKDAQLISQRLSKL